MRKSSATRLSSASPGALEANDRDAEAVAALGRYDAAKRQWYDHPEAPRTSSPR